MPIVAESFATSDFRIRRSKRDKEYVRLIPVRDANGLVLRYALDVAQPGHSPGEPIPVLINPITNLPEAPAAIYEVEDGTLSDPFLETERTYTSGTSTVHAWASRRGNAVTRWRSVFGPPYNLDVEWLSRNGPDGLGSGLSGSARWFEQRQTVGANMHNPTHGGDTNLPTGTKVFDDQLLAPTSPQIHFLANNQRIQGAVVPLEFDPDGADEPQFNPAFFPGWGSGIGQGINQGGEHDGTRGTRCSLYWRHKTFEDVEFHYGGREFFHRTTYWHYQPHGWDLTEFGGVASPLLIRFLASHSGQIATIMQQIGFDSLFYADLGSESPVLTELADFRTVPTVAGRVRFTTTYTRYERDLEKPDEPSLIPSGYALILASRASDGFSVGVATRVGPGPSARGTNLGREEVPFEVVANRVVNPPVYAGGPGPPSTEYLHQIILGVGVESFFGRDPGWGGFHVHVFTGPRTQALSAASELLDSGVLDEPPVSSIMPASVRAGTELADPPSGGGGSGSVGSGGTGTVGVEPEPGAGAAIQGQSLGRIGQGMLANYLKFAGRLK